jgi:3-oxoacyl-[acyl-carrier-protein] synthase II
MYSINKGYNITHVHRGMAFENALLDVDMLLKENPQNRYLLGGVEEISVYNYNIQILGGWYKKETIINRDLYNFNTSGSIAGEGAAMFIVDGQKKNAIAEVTAFSMLHSTDVEEVQDLINAFADKQKVDNIDLLLSGENGDSRFLPFYTAFESILGKEIPIARFKHITGEHQSASSMALWLACNFFSTQSVPEHMIKGKNKSKRVERVLIYNHYEGNQHSLILLNKINQGKE